MSEHPNVTRQLMIDGFQEVDCGELLLCYRGLVYLPGHEAGEDSLRALADRLASEPLSRCGSDLKGVFGLVVINRADDSALVMGDQMGLYKFFYDEQTVSNSFKQLISKRGSAHCRVDDERLIEYMAHGSVYDRSTFVTEIHKIKGDELVSLTKSADGGWQIVRQAKQLTDGDHHASAEFKSYFSHLDQAVAKRRLSADITGGLDTRINLALLMTTKLDFELALSGRPGSVDLEIGQQVADVTGRSMFGTGHDIGHMQDALLTSFEHGDWQTDPLKFHRLSQLDHDRLGRGIDLICHGGGGELFKDFLWLQDFPLLGIKKPNFERFYALRVAPMSCRSIMSETGQKLLDDVRARTIASFKALGNFDNVTGYLTAVVKLRGVEFYGRTFSNHINLGLDVLAPLLDRDNVLAGIRLSVGERLMNAWHRKMIDGHAPKIAEIPSTEGYAPTYGRRFISEVPGYLWMQGRRVLRKSAQKLLGKSLFLEIGAAANDDKNLMVETRQTDAALNSVEIMRARGLFRPDITIDDMRDLHVGRAMALGLFLERLQALPADGIGQHEPA